MAGILHILVVRDEKCKLFIILYFSEYLLKTYILLLYIYPIHELMEVIDLRKSKTPSFALKLPLQTELWQEHILEKRFEVARKLYNDCLGEAMKRARKMKRTPEYQYWIRQPKSKERTEHLNDLRMQVELTEYHLHEYIKVGKCVFEPHLDINTSQKVATRVWKSISDYLFGKGEKVHFKRYGTLHSVEGKTNTSGIRFKNGCLEWLGISCKVLIRKRDDYAIQSLENRVKYVRLLREWVKGKLKYYIQLVLEGIPPRKYNRKTGEVSTRIGKGNVGIDIGTQTVAVVGNQQLLLTELVHNLQSMERDKRILQRKLDRSRRTMNPQNYNKNGTVKKGSRRWNNSNRYKKTQLAWKELNRSIREKRKLAHLLLIKELVKMGDSFFVETMSFTGLQKRAKKTTINEKTGKINRKKRFGKSVGNKAPAMFIRLLEQKVKNLSGTFTKIQTAEAKASQYNHMTDEYIKKQLHQRRSELADGIKVQRDLYSAFLIQHICEDLASFDRTQCILDFPQFLVLHDREIQRLMKNTTQLSSLGLKQIA